ncbi:U-actitoxin-Avd8d-like [Actinia tenebrosa]|uniref:U-actitoxin-Avd8d-like n=1 Tax=Actinia tenebrosa TaxID=6105 RepID=A0A6P8H1G5_ACTTE|nr:U-actitoxin-Avd8d-like [Actinia tenebrosa]
MASSSYFIVLVIASVMLLSQVSGFYLEDEKRPEGFREQKPTRLPSGCINRFSDYICGEVIRKEHCVLYGKKRMNKFAERYCTKFCGFC